MSDICDYEGSDYESRFWKNADRAYEDAVERVAIQRLLPPTGKRIVEFGAGFGRLADLYTGYDEIILLDYSRSLLQQAMQKWGNDPRFKFVAADLYHLPFVAGVLSSATMIRVIHHMADVPAVLKQVHHAMAKGGTFVLEFANKRNAKALVRHALGKQDWSPNDLNPVEFAKLNFDFHPEWMQTQLTEHGFRAQQLLPVSYLRAGAIKKVLPLNAMVKLDSFLQRAAPLYSPSVFTQNTVNTTQDNQLAKDDAIFCSPKSGGMLRRDGNALVCDADGTRWKVDGNFYDFKGE